MKVKRIWELSFTLSVIIIWIFFFTKRYEIITTILLTTGTSVIHFFYYKYIIILRNEFERLNNTIENILTGTHNNQVFSSLNEDNKILVANVNRLAKRIEKMSFKKEEDEQTIQFLTNSITSPILYIDIDGRIRYLNEQCLSKFSIQLYTNDLYEKITIRKLYQFIDSAFIRELDQVEILLIQDRYYQANAIPIKNSHSQFVGILFIFHDITDVKRYETLQREFLADASHELKMPLSAIKGASEILLEGVHKQETIKEFLSIIKDENERMERIVQDILLISRLESDRLMINKGTIDVKQLLENVIEMSANRLKAKNQTIVSKIEEGLMIKGDYDRLIHAFLNLISNAIIYANKGKKLYIDAFLSETVVIIKIRDEGIGISQHELPHIFERFYRVDKARSRETGGTGLGLAIVKTTLDSHKASIKVDSIEGVGTTVTVTFKYIS